MLVHACEPVLEPGAAIAEHSDHPGELLAVQVWVPKQVPHSFWLKQLRLFPFWAGRHEHDPLGGTQRPASQTKGSGQSSGPAHADVQYPPPSIVSQSPPSRF